MEAYPHVVDSSTHLVDGAIRPAADARRHAPLYEPPPLADVLSPAGLTSAGHSQETWGRQLDHAERRDSVTFEPRPRSEMANRAVNVGIAAVAFVLLAPLLVAIALVIRLTSRGPILYQQTRVGIDRRKMRQHMPYDRRMQDLGGQIFAIYKFRTMFVDAEHGTGAVWATRVDPRVTPLGRVLRTCRLDELPQLYNVLRGDMNIVGPRPERPSIFARLREDIAEYTLRQRSKPGITGWAQINHSYDACLDDVRVKVRYDLEYLRRQGMGEDVKIMLRTLPVMLFKRTGW